MRLLFVNETGGPGGAEQTVLNLALAMQQRGHDCLIAVRNPGWVADAAQRLGLPWASTTDQLPASRLATLRGLQRLVEQHEPDLIHAHMFNVGVFAALVGRRHRLPVVCTIHGQSDIQGSSWMRHAKFFVLGRTVRRLLFVSEALQQETLNQHPGIAPLCQVIHNGVPVDDMQTHPIRKRLKDNPVTIGALGNIRRAKGYPVLLAAFAKLSETHPGIRLQIAGQPDHAGLYEALQSQVRQLGLERQVTFLGHVQDVPAFLAEIDCLVSSSLSEGLPLSLIEAMLAEVPIVATRVGGVPELITHGQHGYLCPADDAEALASSITGILSQPAQAAEMARAAAQRAYTDFSVRTMADRHEALYAELCSRNAPQAQA